MHLRHRGHQPLPLLGRHGAEQAGREPVGPRVQLAYLAAAARGEPCRAHALIASPGRQPNQPSFYECFDEASDIARVEPEPAAQLAQIRTATPRADFVQEARGAEGAPAAEEVIVERADPLGDEAVELPDLRNLVGPHCLTVVKEPRSVNPSSRPPPRRHGQKVDSR